MQLADAPPAAPGPVPAGPRRPSRREAIAVTLLTLGMVLALIAACGSLVTHQRWVAPPASHVLRHLLHLGGTLGLVLLLQARWSRYGTAALGLARVPAGRMTGEGLCGLALGVAAALTCFGVAFVAGAYRVTVAPAALHPSPAELLLTFVSLALAAAFEEVAFRSALVGPLSLAFSPWVAVIAPALPFAVLHAINPHASVAGVACIALAGVLLGLLFLSPGQARVPSLFLCTGMHLGWNFTVGRLGVPVSGHAPSSRWLEVQPLDHLWSGGAFGIEAGLGTAVVLAGLCALAAWRIARAARVTSAARTGAPDQAPPGV